MKKKALTKKNYIAIAIITAAIGGWFWYSNNKEEIKEKVVETVIEKTVSNVVDQTANDVKEKTIEKITDLINNK